MPGTSERDSAPRLAAVTPLQPGDPGRVGRYVLSGRLGAGGMGTVYLGRAEGQGQPVAVKVVHPELASDAEFRARFADEAAAARRVAPFCTARVLDADPAADPPYLVTEFVDGVPMGTAVLEGGPLDASTLHGVALGVAAALAAVHAAGVVHRDLKPGNVLLSLSGPRVIDFGIARALDVARQHTQVGMLVGTPGWMAPEQFRAGPVGPPADVFSWGSLVAYGATGRNPWASEPVGGSAGVALPEPMGGSAGVALPPAALAHRILHAAPDLTGLDGPLRRLVEAALAKDPARRPTARQLVDELLGGQRPGGPGAAGPADPTVAASRLVERTWTGLPTLVGPAGAARSGGARPGPPRQHPVGPGPAVAGFPPEGRWPGRPPAGAARPGSSPAGGLPPTRVAGPPPGRVPGPPPGSVAGLPPTRVAGPPPRSVAGPPPTPAPTRVLPPRRRPAGRARAAGRPDPTRVAPPAPPPYAPSEPARPRRRRWFRSRRLLILAGLLVLLALLPYDQRSDPPPRSAPAGPQLGQPVRDGQLEFVVRDVRCGVQRLGEGPLTQEPDGQFCLARVEVTNVKTEARTLFEPFQKLHDSAGEKHGAEVAARLYYRDQTLWDQVRPGESVRGTMVFDIPAGLRPVALELHDGIASGGVTVRLR